MKKKALVLKSFKDEKKTKLNEILKCFYCLEKNTKKL